MMNTFALGCALMAASAAAWTIDMRGSLEESQTIWMKAGETLDVLFDGQPGTGYSWMNDIEYAQMQNDEYAREGHVDFLEVQDYNDAPAMDFDLLGAELNDDEDEIDYRQMPGSKRSFDHIFNTVEGEDFDEQIKFAYVRPWMLRGEFP